MNEALLLTERVQLATRIGESHYREFKSGLQGPPESKKKRAVRDICSDIAKTLVAFANSDGGELFVGIEDDGSITGLPHGTAEIDQIKLAYVTHVHVDTPLPRPQISLVTIEGKAVLYFSISKGNEYAGRYAASPCRNGYSPAPLLPKTRQGCQASALGRCKRPLLADFFQSIAFKRRVRSRKAVSDRGCVKTTRRKR